MWRPIDSPFNCEITSPRKETKYHGMKSYIAYQITPSVSVFFTSFCLSAFPAHFAGVTLGSAGYTKVNRSIFIVKTELTERSRVTIKREKDKL